VKKIAVFMSFLLLASCAHFKSVDSLESLNKERISNHTSFRLGCDKEEISFQCLNKSRKNICQEYGVSACGERSIYSKIGQSWIMTATNKM
jgi:hypothetical protein